MLMLHLMQVFMSSSSVILHSDVLSSYQSNFNRHNMTKRVCPYLSGELDIEDSYRESCI